MEMEVTNMKKVLLTITGLILLLSLPACGKKQIEAPETETESSLLLTESKPTEAAGETEEPTVSQIPDFEPAPSTYPPESQPETTETTPSAAAPSILKQPTGETVVSGATALFIAKAEDADSVIWQFLPPDGGQAESAQKISEAFSPLTITGSETETLTLQNIPMELDGWKVQAEFTGPGGSIHSESALITVTEEAEEGKENSREIDPRLYLPVIRNCQFISDFHPDGHTAEEMKLNDPFHLADGAELVMGKLGYVLLDVDGDGAEELIIAQNNGEGQNYDDNLIVAMFGIQDEKPVKILQSWPRNRHYLYSDGRIYNDGSAGAANSTVYIYTLEDCALKAQQCLWCNDYSEDGEISYFYSPDGIMQDSEKYRITQAEYESKLSQMEYVLPLPALTEIQ